MGMRAMLAGNDFIPGVSDNILGSSFSGTGGKADLHTKGNAIQHAEIEQRLSLLTKSECMVLELLIDGKSDMAIATLLGSGITVVEIQRVNIMDKMQALSCLHLAQMVLAIRSGRQRIHSNI